MNMAVSHRYDFISCRCLCMSVCGVAMRSSSVFICLYMCIYHNTNMCVGKGGIAPPLLWEADIRQYNA